MEGHRFGPGTHKVTVTARDWAGNETTSSIVVSVNEAANEPVGPGAVNLVTGDYKLNATDVSIASAGGDLTVSRSYDSWNTLAGSSGPLGGQWSLNLPDSPADGMWGELTALPNGSVEVETVNGEALTFAAEGSELVPPNGYQTLKLAKLSGSPLEYQLTDASGDATIFKRPSGAEETGSLAPAIVEQASGAGGLNKTTYLFTKTTAGAIEPTEAIAPYPSSINCLTGLVDGCRALEFKYAASTTAAGEGQAQWGDFKEHLKEIKLVAWSPSAKKMESVAVAQYSYDATGRVRAEWDPQAPLKTVYGYDGEGHVTALTAPGQETWAFTYGATTAELPRPRIRLLKAFQAPASTPVWNGEAPANTTAPVITGTPAVGVRLSASTGTWSGSPVSFGYTWEVCGGACTPIPGANGPNFTPGSSLAAFHLAVSVQASNGAGTVSASSSVSSEVTRGSGTAGPVVAPSPGISMEYGVPLSGTGLPTMTKAGVEAWGQGPDVPVEATAIFPADEPMGWPAGDFRRASIFYIDSLERTVNVATPGGGVSTEEYDSHGNLVRSLSADGRVVIGEGGKSAEAIGRLYSQERYNAEGTELVESLGPEHEVRLSTGIEYPARKQVRYVYNEAGAPAGGPYRVPTETTEDAVIVGGVEYNKRTVANSFSGQGGLGWKLHAPTSTTVAPGAMNLVHSATYSATTGAETETAMPGAAAEETGFATYFRVFGSAGSGAGQLHGANAVAVDSAGNVWVSDSEDNRIEEFTASGAFTQAFGWGVLNGKAELQVCTTRCKAGLSGAGNGELSGPQGVAYDAFNGEVYVSDAGNNRVQVFTTAGAWVRAFGEAGKGAGQFNSPHGLSTDSAGDVWVADQSNSRVERFSAEGVYQTSFGKEGKGNGEFSGAGDVTFCGGNLYVVDSVGQRVQELSASGVYITKFGGAGTENGQFTQISRVACDAQDSDLYVTDKGGDRVEVFSSIGGYQEAFGTAGSGAGQMSTPIGVAVSAAGDVYVVDSANNRVQQWIPSISGNAGAFDSQTVYYSPKTEASVAVCQSHPEWASLPCQVQPAHQPESAEAPALPTTTFTYDIYDEPETTKSTSGTQTRTETERHDAAGRLESKEIVSTTGEALPAIAYKYSPETGLLVKQSTGSGSEEKSITLEYNHLGQLVGYTDADGASTVYEYEKEGDYRPIKTTDPQGNRTLAYDSTTGEVTSLKDSGAGTFTATYDMEGNLVSETLPGGLKETITLNPVGEAVGLKYVKKTHCPSGWEWFSDTVLPSIQGQWVNQTSSLETDTYAYNELGWLTETQDTPVGKACAARIYN